MIGLAIVGGLLLFGAARMLHRHRHSYGYACGGGWGHQGYHGHARFGHGYGAHQPPSYGGGGGPPSGGSAPRWILNQVLSRLQTTPSQSREMRAACEQFAEEIEALRGEGKRSREDLAKAVRKPVVDEVLLGELYARHDHVIDKGRKALVGLLARVHEVLEDEQRERLADLIEQSPRFWRGAAF